MKQKLKSIIVGVSFSVVAGFVYLGIFRESSSAFYPLAALVFFGGPLIAGILAARDPNKMRNFFVASGAVFGTAIVLFIITYAVVPQFERVSVVLPE